MKPITDEEILKHLDKLTMDVTKCNNLADLVDKFGCIAYRAGMLEAAKMFPNNKTYYRNVAAAIRLAAGESK